MIKIKSLYIKNFKSFEELTMPFNDKLSVIIGENNIGKSSLFEALFLWKKCYDLAIDSKGSGFYKMTDKARRYIPFVELSFIRIVNDVDLFLTNPYSTQISLIVDVHANEYNLGFKITKPQNIKNSYVRVELVDNLQFERFAQTIRSLAGITLRTSFFIYQTHPVSSISKEECFYNEGQVFEHINANRSSEVLRNMINASIKVDPNAICGKISNVLGIDTKLTKRNTNEKKDPHILINVEQPGCVKELYLFGSGLLQVAEIFSTIDFITNRNSANLFLIDEPDSHIHTTQQMRLLEEIKKIQNVQSVIITHNDAFVSSLKEGELYHLNSASKTVHNLHPIILSDFNNVKRELGGTIIALEQLSKAEKVCFVEGEDDISYIHKLVNKYCDITNKRVEREPVFLWLRGKGNFTEKTKFNRFVLQQINPNLRFCVIFDKDFSTENKNSDLKNKICRNLGIGSLPYIYTHDGYCIESVLFSEIDKLNHLLSQLSGKQPVDVTNFTSAYLSALSADMVNSNSAKYQDMMTRFNSQCSQGGQRPEMIGVAFPDFVNEALTKMQYFFHKEEIKQFVIAFDNHFNTDITHCIQDNDLSKESYSSRLYNLQIEHISSVQDIFNSQIALLNSYITFSNL